MRRIAIGFVMGVAVWVGSALSAEAQVIITPTGPLAINTGATSTTYTATISNVPTSFFFYLWVYVNGVQQESIYFLVVHTGTSANVQIPIDFSQWNPPYVAVKGDVIDFYSKVKVTLFWKASNDDPITVTDPTSWKEGSGTTTLESREGLCAKLEAVDRDRREWA
jgi:hypothetical protein